MTKPLARDLLPGDAICHTSNDVAQVIRARKRDDTGWWLTDGSGVADRVFDGHDEWQLARSTGRAT